MAVGLLNHPEKGPFTGTLVTDTAPAYKAARRELNFSFDIQNCWSHARRKFLTAEPNYPVANEALDLIDELFGIETEAKEHSDLPLLEARALLRSEKSVGLLKMLRQWFKDNATGWVHSDLNKAISYVDKRWKDLTLFLSRPEVPIHTNILYKNLWRFANGKEISFSVDILLVFFLIKKIKESLGIIIP